MPNTKNIYVNAKCPPTNIPLGRQGENLATCVTFDCTGLAQLYGDGTAELLHELKDGTVYPVDITQDGASVSWIVTASDTAKIGSGRAELRWCVGDTLAKSAKFRTSVSPALPDTNISTPPAPYQSWVDKVLKAAQEIKDGAISDEQLAAAIAAYLEEHPIDAELDEAALAEYLTENGYLTDAALADAIAKALADAKASGEFDGDPGMDGTDGGYYTPSVDDAGNLTWTPSTENMPTVPGTNIKGPQGEAGSAGATAEQVAQIEKNTADISQLTEEIAELDTRVAEFELYGGSGAISDTARTLLITILQNGAYKTDQTANITALESALSTGESSGGGSSSKYCSVTNSLSNITTSNSTSIIATGENYTATLTADAGYVIETVTVTMGGVDITDNVYEDRIINIASVTGNILITAIAVESAAAITSWLYHFDNNVYAAGEKSLGIEGGTGTPHYVEGKFGNALATYNGTSASPISGSIVDKPVLDGDFTISLWAANSWRTLTTRNSLLHIAEFISAATTIGDKTFTNKITLIDTENWTIGAINTSANGNAQRAGLNIFWYTTLQVMIMNDDISNGFAFVLTPVNGWDSEWHHYALTRKDNMFYFFVDGKLTVTVEMDSASNQTLYLADNFAIGAYYGLNASSATTLTNNSGAIDELLIDDSTCRYIEDFDVPTVPYAG